MEKAGFFERFIALIVDNIMIAIIAGVLSCCVWFPLSLLGRNDDNLIGALIGIAAFLIWVVILFMQFVYFGYFWGKDGQSLGMKLFNIKVIQQNSDQISFLRGGLRGTFGYWVSSLIFGLGFLWAAFDDEKETWHDKIFDTWVVKT